MNERSGLSLGVKRGLEEEPMKVAVADVRKSYEDAASATKAALSSAKAVNYSIDLPFEMTPTQEEVNMFTIIDANNDGKTWAYRANFKGLVSPSSTKVDCDDWAILPGIRFDNVDKNFEFSFEMLNNMRGSQFESDFEFWLGTTNTVEGMTTKIGEIKGFYSPSTTVPTPQALQFAIPGEAGTYYVAIHCVTKADRVLDDGTEIDSWPTTFTKIAMKQIDSSASAPGKAENLTVAAGANGALQATVSFNMPTATMNGTTIAADKQLTAVVASEVETKNVQGAPGSAQTVVVATKQGNNTISVTINGDADGEPDALTVYTGEVLPMRVHDLVGVLSRDNMTYTLTWTAPTEGEDGGYVDFDNLEYDIYLYDNTNGYEYYTTVGKALTYTYQAEAGAKLRTVRLGVFARSSAGVSQDRVNWIDEDPVYVSDMVGTPYSLPAIENFDNLDMKYTPITIMRPDDYAGRWYIGDPSECAADENQSALMAYNPYSEDATKGRVALPKFSTSGIYNAAFSITAMIYPSYASTMTIYARNYDEAPTELGTIDCGDGESAGWVTRDFPLPSQFQNKEWVQIYIDVDLDDVDYVYAVDSYSLKQSAENDLAAIALTTEEAPRVGEPAIFTAEVANIGFNQSSFTGRFTVTVDGVEVATSNSDAIVLETGSSTLVNYNFTPSADLYGKDVEVTFTINSATDQVSTNNSASLAVDVRRASKPTVLNLKAANSEAGVALSWGEPFSSKELNESFEDLEAFSYGADLAGFTNYDGDKQSVYAFKNNYMPNANVAKAFMVINVDELTSSDGLEANTGKQYLMATCPEMLQSDVTPDAADDWLISPLTVGGEYASFYIDIINASYPETVQVMTSSKTAAPADFTKLDQFVKTKKGWDKHEYKLPADAKYFAIHYVSQDMFGIFIDDVTYTSANDSFDITGYKVYRNGELLATTTDRSYVDGTAQQGETYTYNVTALSPTEGAMSNSATLICGVEGLTEVSADAAAAADFYNLQGVKVSGTQLVKGIYIRKQGNNVEKVIIK
jgi:hypothetical protein